MTSKWLFRKEQCPCNLVYWFYWEFEVNINVRSKINFRMASELDSNSLNALLSLSPGSKNLYMYKIETMSEIEDLDVEKILFRNFL